MSARPSLSPPSAHFSGWPLRLLLLLAIGAVYHGTLSAPFVYDDILAIPQNPTIRQLWPLSNVLLPQTEGGLTVSGRPVLNLSFALNYAVSGTSVWSYHLFNVVVHGFSALLLAGIVRRTVERWRAGTRVRTGAAELSSTLQPDAALHLGLAAAALWALHPLLTQAVTYTVQRAESLMGFFYLLTLYGFVRATERRGQPGGDSIRLSGSSGSPGWVVVSVAACVLGMGTKEVMATAPLLVLLYDGIFIAGTFGGALRTRWKVHLALAATWLVLAALVVSTGGNRGGTVGLGVGVPLWAYPATQFQAVARYLALSVWPQPLVFEYGTFWVKRAVDILPYAAVVTPLLAASVWALRYRPALGFCGAWFFLTLAPSSLAPGTIQMIVEHRMYLPLAAAITAAIVGAHRWLGRHTIWPAVAAAVALGVATYRRNEDYRSPLALWTDTVAKRPDNPRAHTGRAETLESLGRVKEAVQHRQEAVRLLPDESTYHYNLAKSLTEAGRIDDAIRHYRLALRLFPNEARTHNNLAILLVQTGDPSAALVHYAEAVRLKPQDALYHYNCGVALSRVERHAEAAARFEQALQLQPGNADAHFNLAAALTRLSRLDEALMHYAAAVRLKPTDVEYLSAHGNALLIAGQPEEALVQCRAALAQQPDALTPMFGAANALAALKRHDEAIAQYRALLRRAPEHANAHFKLGNVLLDANRIAEAAEHYVTATRLKPDDAEAHHNLGIAYARMERWREAQAAFETALRLKPDYGDARRHLDQLKSLLGR